MADRHSDQGRSEGGRSRYGRGGRWSDQGGRGGRQSGPHYGRTDEDEDDDARQFDQDRDEGRGMGGYGGGYGQGMSGQTYGGGYSERRPAEGRFRDEDWDGGAGMEGGREYFQGQGRYAQGGYQGYGDQGRGQSGQHQQGQNFGQGGARHGGDYGGRWGSAGRHARGGQGGERFGGMAESGYDQGYGYRGQSGLDQGYGAGGQSSSQAAHLSRGGRQQWGRHAGRGPKNYVRSDERIRDDINDRLTDDPELDATEIDVKVANCEVTLGGTVDSREAKRRAEDLVETVSGVKHVQNNLRVQPAGMSAEDPTARAGKRGGKPEGDGEKLQ